LAITRRIIKVTWALSVTIGILVVALGILSTFPSRPFEIINRSTPVLIDDFTDTSKWQFNVAGGTDIGDYEIARSVVTTYESNSVTIYGNYSTNSSGDLTVFKASNSTVTIYGNYTTQAVGNYTTITYGNYTYIPIGGADISVIANDTGREYASFKRSASIDPKKHPYLGIEYRTATNALLGLSVKDSSGSYMQVLSGANTPTTVTETINLRKYTNNTIEEIVLIVEDYPESFSSGEVAVHIDRLFIYPSLAIFTWDEFIILGLVASLLGPSIVYYFEGRRKDAIDKHLPNLMRDIAEAGRTGMTLTRAIEVSSEQDYGPLTDELRKMTTQLTWKVPLDKALQSFADRCDTLLARRAAMLILEASRTGGDIQASIETVNRHIQEIQNLDQRRKSQMRPYIGIIYISFFVFLITVYILVTSFFGMLSKPGTAGFVVNPTPIEVYIQIFLYMGVVEAFFGGLTGGKMSTGFLKNGLKHATILTVISFIVFNFFV